MPWPSQLPSIRTLLGAHASSHGAPLIPAGCRSRLGPSCTRGWKNSRFQQVYVGPGTLFETLREARRSAPGLNLYYQAGNWRLNPHLEFSRAASRKVTLKHPRVEKQRGLKVACAKVPFRANSSPIKSPCRVSQFPTPCTHQSGRPCPAQVTP